MEKARSFSSNIVEGSDDAIVVTDESLRIQLANASFGRLVRAADHQKLTGTPIETFFESELFSLALGGVPTKNKQVHLSQYSSYVEATVSYDPHFHIIIAVFRDVTSLVEERIKEEERAKETSRLTAEVIEKNMRAVQEIASLLGQSAAETKVALTELENVLTKGKGHDE